MVGQLNCDKYIWKVAIKDDIDIGKFYAVEIKIRSGKTNELSNETHYIQGVPRQNLTKEVEAH